ncbi:MAG: 50S ribosomal protein L25 [Treponemataceae bacterium]|nr:50S ribosomal protein L25 [Treponemataceae bacterium]
MDNLVLAAKERKESGKAVAKKLRSAGRLPAVMYNSKGEATMLDIDELEFTKLWKVATPTTLITLDVNGKKSLAFIKDTEYDIKADKNLHVDFHVIDESKVLKATIKVQVSGSPIGVREGGFFELGTKEIVIECLPKDLPVRLVVDVTDLKMGASMAVKDINLPKGVKVVSDSEAVIARVRNIQ